MSSPQPFNRWPRRRIVDLTIALLSACALIPAWSIYRADVTGRKPVRDFVRRFMLDKRRPEVVRTLAYAPSPEWAAEIIADTVLRDAYGIVDLTNATPEVREAWIAAAQSVGEELEISQGALLDAVSRCVGWPFYQSLLGQTAFTRQSRNLQPELISKSATWSTPLLNAARAAPAATQVWQSLAVGYLQTWPLLARTHEATADEVFTRAFSQTHFVVDAFGHAIRLLGTERAMSYLPSTARPLRVAFEQYANINETRAAWTMHQRWERIEWRERARDLSAIEARRRHPDEVAAAIDSWLGAHSIWHFDSPAAHAQAARLLELWPDKPRGAWTNDLLADVVRYLLTRSESPERFAPLIARSVRLFSQVSLPVLAEVKLLSGDVAGAERLVESAEDTATLSWSRYRLAFARHQARASTAQREPPAAAEPPAEPGPERQCGVGRQTAFGGVPVDRVASIRLEAQIPTIVEVTVNGARWSTMLVDGTRELTVPLPAWREVTISGSPLSGDRDACLVVPSVSIAGR